MKQVYIYFWEQESKKFCMTGCQKTNSYVERNSTRIESWGRPKLRMYRWIRMQLDTFEITTRFQSKYSIWPEIFGYPHTLATEMDSRIRLRNFWKAQSVEKWILIFARVLIIVLRNTLSFLKRFTRGVDWKIKLKRAIFYYIGINFIHVIEYTRTNNGEINLSKRKRK